MRHRSKTTLALGLAASTILYCGVALAQTPVKADSNSWRASVIARAPVADPKDIPKDSSLWDAHRAGKLTYGGSKTQKLFSLQNPITGELEGFDATMALLLAKYVTGKPVVEEKIVTSETREALLNNKSIQAVLYTYSITPEREKKVDFAGPYFISGQSIAVREATNDIAKLEDLAKRKVCVTKGGTAYLTMTKRVPTADLITLESSGECETTLRQGRVDAEVQDRAVLLGQVSKGGLKLVGSTITYEPYGIGLPHNSAKSVAFLNNWLKTLIKDDIWQEVFDHTLGQAKGAKANIPVPGENLTPKLNLD
ncbi:MAG: transporter substrate-binding domain-containing protein [Paralcaligenes sp.]